MDWHLLSAKEVINKLESSEQGLTKKQIEKKLSIFGENKLKKIKHFDAIKVFLEQFKSFLIIILILAAVISFIMESKIDALVILAIIILNAGIGFFQEYKADKAIEDLKKLIIRKTKVLRNGKIAKIDSRYVVPGDIIVINEGDNIIADARIIESEGLRVNESSLTGESSPVEKISSKLDDYTPLTDRINMVYQGTQAISGSAKAIVVNTGINTEIGKISELVQEIKPEKNPFKDKLDRFAKKIGIFIIILSLIIVFLLILIGSELFQSFLVAVSLAVAAIPEGLPAVISLGLALATGRMIKRNILIRKLSASETLGRVTVICADKTGTITEGEMQVRTIYTNGKINPAKGKELLFKIGVLCNKARIEENKGNEYFIGDPTEIALIISAKNNFVDKKELINEEPKIKEFPFTSERKMMSVVRKNEKKIISYVKGAPEKIIERSSYELINGKKIKLERNDKIRLKKVYEEMAEQGHRVLGFAYKQLTGYITNKELTQKIAEEGLVFVGFQGMIDGPRPEVKNSIALAKQAGINVIMMTGDSKLTADAVAKQIGLTGKSIDYKELDSMSDKQLFKEISQISVFSRISPKDKLRIVNILKQRNEIVAMTGDGVNDALALKRADIGIAMGIKGTDVTRDSSDIILTDDNFASIIEGVKEGRTVFNNIRKFIKFLLTANFSEVFLVFFGVVVLRNPELLPLLPLQILWINLVTDSLPALALSSEPMEKDVMKNGPGKQEILNGIKSFIIIAGLITFLVGFLFFYWYIDNIDLARTMVVTALIVFEMFLVFSCKSEKSIFQSPMNKYLFYAVFVSIVVHIIALYTIFGSFFNFVPLSIIHWSQLIVVSLIAITIIEGLKKYKLI